MQYSIALIEPSVPSWCTCWENQRRKMQLCWSCATDSVLLVPLSHCLHGHCVHNRSRTVDLKASLLQQQSVHSEWWGEHTTGFIHLCIGLDMHMTRLYRLYTDCTHRLYTHVTLSDRNDMHQKQLLVHLVALTCMSLSVTLVLIYWCIVSCGNWFNRSRLLGCLILLSLYCRWLCWSSWGNYSVDHICWPSNCGICAENIGKSC